MNATERAAANEATALALAGKYMTFKLGREDYGLQILKVRELIGLMDITRVPGTANFVRGVINLRGKVIPVVDMRQKFGMGATEPTDQTVIVVAQLQSKDGVIVMGILVDEVLEVLDIPEKQIEPPPQLSGNAIDTEFILGVGKAEKRVIFLLDIDRVLSAQERTQLASAAA